MKVCAIICEYNPFHFGHLKQIEYVKNTLNADKIICVMSGNFTQRGEIAVLDKFTRAKHAIIAGADMVIELPTVFATANAELFAKGAIKIIDSLNIVDSICFGVESGVKEDYVSLAKAMNDESKEFKKILKEKLDSGISLAKAKFETLKELGEEDLKEELISSPNNILGLEYTKALLSLNSSIEIEPLLRENIHNDIKIKSGITSALSIREKIKIGKIKSLKKSVPKFVYSSLKPYPYNFEKILLSSVITEDIDEMSEILDCTEGLENRIKALIKDNLTLQSLIEKVATKRYTEARVRRILLSTLLKVKKDFIIKSLNSDLYAKVLAINGNDMEFLSAVSNTSKYPLLTRKSDAIKLKGSAMECFDKDVLANDIYNLVSQTKTNENNMLIL